MSTKLLERPIVTNPDGPLFTPPDDPTVGFGGNRYHIGRSFLTAGPMEADCPCIKAPCGLVAELDEFCSEHGPVFAKTMRARHHERDCPLSEFA